jgi:transglutaminase superfamily protein
LGFSCRLTFFKYPNNAKPLRWQQFMKTIISFISLLILAVYPRLSISQQNFQKIDSFVISIGSCDSMDIPKITSLLTTPFNDGVSKTRAIYAWIANNISYDCLAFHAPSKRVSNPEKVLKLRKAVCEGYANLFQEMCSNAKVQCLTIDGYARTSLDDIGVKPSDANHTWNAVRIDGAWKLIDVTWASGVVDKKVKHFTRKFSSFYFFTDPNKFLFSHYPKLNAWLLTKPNISFKEFYENPIIDESYFSTKIKGHLPKDGTIKSKQDNTNQITITAEEPNSTNKIELQVGDDVNAHLIPCDLKTANNSIIVSFKYNKTGIFPLYLVINSVQIMMYRLEVD